MEKSFKDILNFLDNMKDMAPEIREAELKTFNVVDRTNIKCTEYIAADIYPQKHVNRDLFKLSITFQDKVFYPIVGWNPDSIHPNGKNSIPVARRWLNSRIQYRLHNSKEDRTYILYA